MSRTYKDKPTRLRFKDKWEYVPDLGIYLYRLGGPKVKKRVCDNDFWYKKTPSAWTRLMMNRPKRRECRVLEELCVGYLTDALEEVMFPLANNKPHIYYY